MLLKLHVSCDLREARQFKINFLSVAFYDTVTVTDSLSSPL